MTQNMTRQKPTIDAKMQLDYPSAIAYLAEKYDFNAHDFSLKHGKQAPDYYAIWCRKHKHPVSPKAISTQQQIFSLYCDAPDGLKAEPEPQNVYTWFTGFGRLLDHNARNRKNGPSLQIPFNGDVILASYDTAVAPILAEEQDRAQAMLENALKGLDSHLHDRARHQYRVKPTALPEYIKTVIGYIQAEFGNKFIFIVE